MSNALEIAEHLSRLGTDVFVVYSPEDDLFPTPNIKFYKSEAKHYVSDLDDFIGAEVEISVNIDEPLPFAIKKEDTRKETSEGSPKETPKELCREITPGTKQNMLPKTPVGKVSIKYKSHTRKDRFSCVFRACYRNYSSKSNLFQHIRDWHYNVKNYSCQICDKKFARRSTLRNHQRVHTGPKPFGCNICEQRFESQFILKVHQLECHGKDDNRCRSCNKKFPNEYELRFHELAHEGNQCFVCRICNTSFMLSFDLDRHECSFANIDIGIDCNKPPPPPPPPPLPTLPKQKKQIKSRVSCKVCHKELSRNYVRTHEDIYHFKVRIYECQICGNTFTTTYSLNQHIRYVHNGDKKNTCVWCKKSFARKTCLNRHVKGVHKRRDVGTGEEFAIFNVNNNKNDNNLQQG